LYYITAFYHGKKEFFTINIINTALNIVQTIFLAMLFFSGKSMLHGEVGDAAANAVLWMMTVAVAVQVICMAVLFRFKYQQYFKKIKLSAALVKGLFAYSGLTFISSILLFLVSRADFYFVEKYCDAHALGNYVQAAKIGQMALILPGLLGGVVFPFSIGAADAFAEKIAFLCRMLTLFFVVLFIMVLTTGYYILPWLLGKEFDAVFTIILLILPGIYFMSIGLIILSYLEGKNKQVIILFANLVVLVLIIAADLYFVPKYKYTGAAVIFSLSNLAGVAILLHYFLKHTSVKIKSLFAVSFSDVKKLR
jgi:O-antigen/teichoic acid export membrane protein